MKLITCMRVAPLWLLVAPICAQSTEDDAPVASDQDHDSQDEILHSDEARIVEHDRDSFRPSPSYQLGFDAEQQQSIYGDKRPVPTQRPLLEWGRALYSEGPFKPGINVVGKKNLLFPHFMVYGDWRTAIGYSDNGASEVGRLATRLNLDLDLGLTATERIHAFMRPLDKNGEFTRVDFAGDTDGEKEFILDGNLETLFFEGDLGAMFGGPGVRSLPIAVGKIPLLFQNGVWVEDAFNGIALSLPGKNSRALDISNYDVTFFAGFDDVTSRAIIDGGGDDHDATIVGVTAFLEANEGYWEVGYGYTAGADTTSDLDYHNLTAAFSRRYGAWLSNTIRGILNVGQDPDPGVSETADGFLLLVENSLITSKPSTLIPYFNLFAGFGTPQALSRAADAGGVLKNTGINFETDALTVFPKLEDSGHDTYGAALGIQYLFNLDKQLVFEVAGLHPHGNDARALGDQLALGVRFQIPISHRFIIRADAIAGAIEDGDDIAGVRIEFRWKF